MLHNEAFSLFPGFFLRLYNLIVGLGSEALHETRVPLESRSHLHEYLWSPEATCTSTSGVPKPPARVPLESRSHLHEYLWSPEATCVAGYSYRDVNVICIANIRDKNGQMIGLYCAHVENYRYHYDLS